MRHTLLTTLVLACTTFSSAAHAQARTTSSPAVVPAQSDSARLGTYALEITTDNGTMTGLLAVKKTDKDLTATLTVGGHSPDVKSFKRAASGYVLDAGTSSFTVSYALKFADDSVKGTFRMSTGLTGTVAGARQAR